MSKILIIGPSWVGDMVMAQSLFMVLKQHNPNNQITVLAPPWSNPLLERMPEVTTMVSMAIAHGQLGWSVRRRLAQKLRQAGFDQAIVIPGSFKSALVPWLARIPLRTGFVGEQRWGLINDRRKLDKRAMPLNVQRFVALAPPGSIPGQSEIPQPALSIDRPQVNDTAVRFEIDAERQMVAICPGAEYGPAKQWPVEHFAEVANAKLDQGWQVGIFGSDRDQSTAASINTLCQQRCVDLTGRTSLGEAVDLMSVARFAVTNDSGLMHVAAAVGCHVIAIYGSSSDAFTPPLTEKCHRLNLHLECSPCFKRECPLGHLNCLRQLKPDRVLSILH